MEKYIATLIIYTICDCIGFFKGKWGLKYYISYESYKKKMIHNNIDYLMEIMSDFLYFGGVTNIQMDQLSVSDKSNYHSFIMAKLINNNSDKEILDDIKNNIFDLFNKYIKQYYKYHSRDIDKEYKIFDKPENAWEYRSTNGATTRCIAIGLYLNGKKNRERLIDISIKSCKITHNSPISYLSGLTSALFIAYAIENISIDLWPIKLLKLLESDYVKKYIDQNEEDLYDYLSYIKYWRKYIDTRFKNKKPLVLPIFYQLYGRISYFNEHFVANDKEYLGESGVSAIIVAYDCLLTSGKNWERLIYYSLLNIGDIHTICILAGSMYGALYGFEMVPKYLIDTPSFIKIYEDFGLYKFAEFFFQYRNV